MTTITLTDYHNNNNAAEEAAEQGPVLITQDGRPKNILLTFEDYQQLDQDKKKNDSAEQHTTNSDKPLQGTLMDWILSMPPQPDDLADYDFPIIKDVHKPFEFE